MMKWRVLTGLGLWALLSVSFSHAYPVQARPQTSLSSRVARPVYGIVLNPSGQYQTRGFLVPARKSECQAVARAHPQVRAKYCFLRVTVNLRSRNARPIQTGSPPLTGRHVQTAYTSMTVCLSGPTMAGHGDCYRTAQNCGVSSLRHLPSCYPAWDDRVSAQFQYNGKVARRIWFDPSLNGGYGFIVRSSVPPYPKTSTGTAPLIIGDTLTVAGGIPLTHQVHVEYAMRITVSADGRVRYNVW
jgi:hypothetical protein